MAIFTQEARCEKAKSFYNDSFTDGVLDLWFCIAKKLTSWTDSSTFTTEDTWDTTAPFGWSDSWNYSDSDVPSPAIYPLSTYPYNSFNPLYDSTAVSPNPTVPKYGKGLPGAYAYRRVLNIVFCRPLTSEDLNNTSNLDLIYYLNSYYAVVDANNNADMEKYKPSLLCLKCSIAPGDLDSTVETGSLLQIGIYKGLKKKNPPASQNSNIAIPDDFDSSDANCTQGTLMLVENIVPHQRLAYNQDTRLFMLQF